MQQESILKSAKNESRPHGKFKGKLKTGRNVLCIFIKLKTLVIWTLIILFAFQPMDIPGTIFIIFQNALCFELQSEHSTQGLFHTSNFTQTGHVKICV